MAKIRVLVAEDQTIWRDIYTRVLEESPQTKLIEAVANGQAAVEAAKTHQPDVVLLDIQMPGLNGIEAAKQIRSALPEVGVILMSHHAQRQYAQAFLRDGTAGKAYLLKNMFRDPIELIPPIEVVHQPGAIMAP